MFIVFNSIQFNLEIHRFYRTLNSSDISVTKEVIFFMSTSTDASPPVFNSVVIANVAIERWESAIRFPVVIAKAKGCVIATYRTFHFIITIHFSIFFLSFSKFLKRKTWTFVNLPLICLGYNSDVLYISIYI